MKLSKFILAASVVALSFVSAANAATVIRFTGSSAFRAQCHAAIKASLTTGYTYGYTSSSTGLDGATQAIFVGQYSGADVIIETNWTGSEGGITSVGNSKTTNFLDETNSTLLASLTTGGVVVSAGSNAQLPDIALSDTLQATSAFATTATPLTEVPVSAGSNKAVGVVPFVWVASKNARYLMTGGSTATPNVTTAQVRSLYSNAGYRPLSLFTGNNADHSKLIIAMGRNQFSGTRVATFGEGGIGANYMSTKQYLPVPASTGTSANTSSATGFVAATGTIGAMYLWPVETYYGVSTGAVGNSGYDSGGKLAAAMGSDDSDFYLMKGVTWTRQQGTAGMLGYISVGDANAAIPAGGGAGTFCTWNGVAYSPTAIQEGQYSFWSFEHMYYRNNANTTVTTFAKSVADACRADTSATTLVQLGNMQVTRTADAGVTTFKFAY